MPANNVWLGLTPDFNEDTNWNQGHVPTDTETAEINADLPFAPTINSDVTVNALEVNNTSITGGETHLTVKASVTLTNTQAGVSLKALTNASANVTLRGESILAIASGARAGTVTATCDYPTASRVLTGTSFAFGSIGTRDDAVASKVLDTESYGDPDAETVGLFALPAANTVLAPGVISGGATGTTYGASGNTEGTNQGNGAGGMRFIGSQRMGDF